MYKKISKMKDENYRQLFDDETQEVSYHNEPTHKNGDSETHTTTNKVYCEHPITICNPSLPGFLTRCFKDSIYYTTSNGGVTHFFLPLIKENQVTKQKRKQLKKYVNRFIRMNNVTSFLDMSTGETMDALIQVPCGHCTLCSEKKRRGFANRCSMECQSHEHLPLFVTLTYDDEFLPENGVQVRDVQLFLKNLRVNLQRDGYSDLIRTAYCGEYGSKYHRPHYHLLIWNFPRHGHFKYLPNIDAYIRSCWMKGLTQTKFCRDTKAGYYLGKYFTKQSDVPYGCNPQFHRCSINLGVNSVKEIAESVLHNSPDYTELKYRDKFTGKLETLPLTKYFIDKILPKYTTVNSDIRYALEDYKIIRDKYYEENKAFFDRIDSTIKVPLPEVNLYDRTDINKLSEVLLNISKISGVEFVDFDFEQAVRDEYFNELFKHFDPDLSHQAYKINKQRKIEKEKEKF